jgi:glycosyltransferase involved in cell wall biosynthesis
VSDIPLPADSRPTVPGVTVSMPAFNAAPFIAAAIESVVSQQGIEVDLVVVDDGSTDGTGDIAARYADRGVRVLRNGERRGIGFCHNRVIANSVSPLIAHVDADDLILPGGLAKVAAAAMSDDRVGQAYCDFYDIARDGIASRESIEDARRFFARHRAPPINHRRELVVHGMVVSALRIYRRAVFDLLGGFDEQLPWAVDYEMALRIGEHFLFAHVPELLYARRVHPAGASQGVSARPWRQWWMRWKLVRRRLAAQHGSLLGRGRVTTHARLLLGLAYVARGALTPARIVS